MHLALEVLDALAFGRRDTFALAGIDLMLADPVAQLLRQAADLAGDGLHNDPLRRVLVAVLKHHAHGALTHLGWARLGRTMTNYWKGIDFQPLPGVIRMAARSSRRTSMDTVPGRRLLGGPRQPALSCNSCAPSRSWSK
jgi:hypothetical protein